MCISEKISFVKMNLVARWCMPLTTSHGDTEDLEFRVGLPYTSLYHNQVKHEVCWNGTWQDSPGRASASLSLQGRPSHTRGPQPLNQPFPERVDSVSAGRSSRWVWPPDIHPTGSGRPSSRACARGGPEAGSAGAWRSAPDSRLPARRPWGHAHCALVRAAGCVQ